MDPSPAFDLNPSAAAQRSWNRSTTVEMELSVFASDVFYWKINAINLHDLHGLSADSPDIGTALTFTLVSTMSGEALSGGFLYGLAYVYVDCSGTHGFPDPLVADGLAASIAAQHDGVWRLSTVFDRSIL